MARLKLSFAVLGMFGVLGCACAGRARPPASSPSVPTTVTIGPDVATAIPSSSPAAEPPGIERADAGVLTPADEAVLKAATIRARSCLAKANVRGRVEMKIVLSDEGRPAPEPLAYDDRTVPGAAVRCINAALAQGRYSRPGTQTKEGTTKRFILLRVEAGLDPVEYQVD